MASTHGDVFHFKWFIQEEEKTCTENYLRILFLKFIVGRDLPCDFKHQFCFFEKCVEFCAVPWTFQFLRSFCTSEIKMERNLEASFDDSQY